MSAILILLNRLVDLAAFFRWLPPLLARITLGVVFIQSGWGKLHNLEKVQGFFESLGIPAAHIQAPFVAGLEFVGGILILVGLATRLISLPLIGTMVVATLTARKEELTDFSALTGFIEYLYILLFIYLVVEGAGLLSLDALLGKKIKKHG